MYRSAGVARSTAPHGQRTGVVQAQSPAARFARLSNTDKLGVALRSTVRAVGPEMGGKLQELISPTNLAIVAGALAIWVGAHATPIGWVVDIGMVGLGAVALGVEAVNVMRELQAFAMGVIKAQSEADLAEAGQHLAKAIAIVGVDLVVALLLKKAIVKVRQPAMKGGEAADGTKLFGKYDPKDAARSLPAEASVAAGKKPLGTAVVANSAGIADGLRLSGTGPTRLLAREPVELAAQRRLNALDGDVGKFRPGEAGVAAEMENYLGGTLTRAPAGTSADFIVETGPFAGARMDLKLTPDTFDQASKINSYFDKTFPKFSESFAAKLANPNGVDLMPFDTRFLTPSNSQKLFDFVDMLPLSSQQKIIYLVH